MKDLNLTEREEKRLKCLVGARYKSGRNVSECMYVCMYVCI